jgi:predicted RNA-binding Zn ribbon-like protein
MSRPLGRLSLDQWVRCVCQCLAWGCTGAPNGYSRTMSISPTQQQLSDAGFPMGGEPMAAIDLVDTVMTGVEPPRDLLADPAQLQLWWELQAVRLPPGPRPGAAGLRRLRAAIRDLLDAHQAGRAPLSSSVEDLNAAAAGAPRSVRLVGGPHGYRSDVRWHEEFGGNQGLSAIAHEAIALLSDPDRLARLRRCANPSCSMLFLAQNKSRTWCSSRTCGNRARVARHYQRTHPISEGTS